MTNAYPHSPGHRGVETSVAAADAIASTTGTMQRLALTLIREAGLYGLTALETCAKAGIDRWAMQPRLSELRRMGLIRDSGQRRRNASGKSAIVWIAVHAVIGEAA